VEIPESVCRYNRYSRQIRRASKNSGEPSGSPASRIASTNSPSVAALLGFVLTRFGVLALIVLAAIVALVAWLAMRQIAGQTGDVLGALEQVSEIAVLLVALG